MPNLTETMQLAMSGDRSRENLARACAILRLPIDGTAEELRDRLRLHLAALEPVRTLIGEPTGATASQDRTAGPTLSPPADDEFAPAFADEIALVPPADDFAEMLAAQFTLTRALAATFGESHAALRYGPDKWSVRQTIGHLSDCERVLSYRLLRAMREDEEVLPGFDHVRYVDAGRFESRTLASTLDEFAAVRAATVALMASAPAERFAFRLRVGSGSITGRALAYLIAGHERHHQQLLRERYLPLLPPTKARSTVDTQ